MNTVEPFFVASAHVRDLLLCAKRLFVAVMGCAREELRCRVFPASGSPLGKTHQRPSYGVTLCVTPPG